MKQENGINILGLILGGVIGAGLTVLLTSKGGKEARQLVKEYAKRLDKKFKMKMDNFKNYTKGEIERFKEEMYKTIQEGKNIFKKENKNSEENPAEKE